MKKVLMIALMSTTIVSGAQAQDYGVRESTAWYGELMHKWETTNMSTWTGLNSATERQIVSEAASAQETTKDLNSGWCNEALVWAMNNVGIFENNVEIDAGSLNTMRGRHFSTHYNDKVTESFNHDDTWDWNDVPIGTVALIDHQATPSNTGNLGLDHTTTFMGKMNDEWGWFLGGNQSGRLQPKLYRLANMTHASLFSEQGAEVKKHYYDNVEEMARIKIEDGTWTKSNVSGWAWGKNKQAKAAGYGSFMSSQWNNHGINTIQKFQSGDNVVYVNSTDSMEVYEGQIIRTHDYYDHEEINAMKNHIGQHDMLSTSIQKDHSWWDSRTNQDSQTFRNANESGSQWHDRVYTAKAINEALDTQWDRAFDSVFSNSHRDLNGAATEFVALFNDDADAKAEHYDYTLARELYMEYDVKYYDDDETLMSNHYNTQ